MGKQIMARKRGLKRSKPPEADGIKKSKKHDSLPSPAVAEPLGDAALEEDVSAVSMEPSTFHNLLKALGSGSQKLANLYKRREQEGRSDSEEDDEDDGYESDGLFEEEEDGEEGLDNESSLEGAGEGLRKCRSSDILKEGKQDVSEDDEEVSDADDVHDTESETFNNVDEAENTSPFQRHLGHTLSTEDAENLMKEQWKYKWEMPAINISMSKWVGTGEHLPEEVSNDMDHGIKQRLYEHWLNICGNSGSSDFNSSRWRSFFSLCNSYRDIMHCSKKPFYLKGVEEDSIIMDAYIMHALNHVYKTRDLVIKNDAKLAKHQESGIEDVLGGGTFLDQGFTRPKVMFLLPLRSIALRVMRRLIQLAPLSKKDNVQHWDRFSKEFGSVDVEEEDDANGGSSRSRKSAKPVDYQLLFGGNNDDNFMLGIKFTKRSMKLYSDFYSSDIIIASPVGLLPKIEDTRIEKEKDIDYLSSIEVLIIDHADVIAMQNWSHLNTVVEQLNHLPSKQHGTDVMRIRQWCLDGHARFYRQTILLSSFLNPDMNAMFNRLCLNYEGKVKLISECKGVLPKVLLQVRQVYERFQAPSIVDSDDSRLDYFCKKVFPKITDSIEGGTMLFISSYFELVRIRNFLKSQNASFCLLDEYRKQSDISRARVWFFEGKRKIMLYTERAHYYHRYKIRGIQNLIIYSLPERKDFYPEILNMLEGSEKMVCNVLFSRYDQLKLERIVGTAAAKRMVSSEKNAFVFC